MTNAEKVVAYTGAEAICNIASGTLERLEVLLRTEAQNKTLGDEARDLNGAVQRLRFKLNISKRTLL